MKLRVVVAEAWRSLTASLSTTLAAALTVLIGMFLVGLLIGLGTWAPLVERAREGAARRQRLPLHPHHVRPRGDGRGEERGPPQAPERSADRPGNVEYISKQQALEKMRKKAPEMVANVLANPFPDAFKVKPKHGEDVVAIADSLDPPPAGVEKVNFGKKTASRILRVAHIFEVLSCSRS